MPVQAGTEEGIAYIKRPRPDERPTYGSALPSHWQPWWDSYELSLLGDSRQPATLVAYHGVLVQFARFLTSEGQVPILPDVQPDDIRRWMAWLKQNRKPTTANMRYRGLHSFFQWM
ncbi:MAG: site-specific integrase, partial [Candidatus Dormibacteraeota bacterium]|nr:site-specific integrase [Candidatus Dormibacteraeota bacterium]